MLHRVKHHVLVLLQYVLIKYMLQYVLIEYKMLLTDLVVLLLSSYNATNTKTLEQVNERMNEWMDECKRSIYL